MLVEEEGVCPDLCFFPGGDCNPVSARPSEVLSFLSDKVETTDEAASGFSFPNPHSSKILES